MSLKETHGVKRAIELWEEFLQHPCWKELEGIAKEQAHIRAEDVLLGEHTPDQTLIREFSRGEYSGINLVLATATTILTTLEEDLAVIQQEMKDEKPAV